MEAAPARDHGRQAEGQGSEAGHRQPTQGDAGAGQFVENDGTTRPEGGTGRTLHDGR